MWENKRGRVEDRKGRREIWQVENVAQVEVGEGRRRLGKGQAGKWLGRRHGDKKAVAATIQVCSTHHALSLPSSSFFLKPVHSFLPPPTEVHAVCAEM